MDYENDLISGIINHEAYLFTPAKQIFKSADKYADYCKEREEVARHADAMQEIRDDFCKQIPPGFAEVDLEKSNSGPILAYDDYYALQKVGKTQCVVHEMHKLDDQFLQLNVAKTSIKYDSHNCATVIFPNKQIER